MPTTSMMYLVTRQKPPVKVRMSSVTYPITSETEHTNV
eukprot:CAMPEP_0194487672 /NCGR_PEP_ID=MMETSP0253-20130528/7878_1 /TAXON_ID=2966 /ORGANISM="Noctiluca scintillans" /LENGTH=37 /DNA_ID= /DNA_START= /DNA_END= /DNA_ORIENTATION=